MELTGLQRKITRAYIARIGIGLFALLGVAAALQFLLGWLFSQYWPQAVSADWYIWALLIASQYAAATLVAWLIIRGVPRAPIQKRSLTVKQFLLALLICYSIMMVGNLLGQGVSFAFNFALGAVPSNYVTEMLLEGVPPLGMLCVGVLAPIVEEFIFRKLLIDRMARYGQWVAVLFSALVFGLYHGNFYQFFYAFGVGLAFGYLYVKTGKIWYTMLLHGIVNSIPLLILPVLQDVTNGNLMSALPLMGILIGIFCAAIAGIVLFFLNKKRIRFIPRVSILPQKGWARYVFLNPGVVLMLVGCAALFVMNMIPMG